MTAIETVARAINKAAGNPAYVWSSKIGQAKAAIDAIDAIHGNAAQQRLQPLNEGQIADKRSAIGVMS